TIWPRDWSSDVCSSDLIVTRAAVAGDDVDDTGGQLGLADHVAEKERRERRRLRGLEDDRIACRQRRRDLPREHQQREVPGDDLRSEERRVGNELRGRCE